MTTLNQIATRIIEEQELVMGPLAWSEAGKVRGLAVDTQKREAVISNGDPKAAVDRLVAQYERLFGHASHEVCKDAVATLIRDFAQADVPSSLRA